MPKKNVMRDKVTNMVESIPNDGCLLVFNADHALFRSVANGTGLLSCHVAESGHVQRELAQATIRDLYIRWRD